MRDAEAQIIREAKEQADPEVWLKWFLENIRDSSDEARREDCGKAGEDGSR